MKLLLHSGLIYNVYLINIFFCVFMLYAVSSKLLMECNVNVLMLTLFKKNLFEQFFTVGHRVVAPKRVHAIASLIVVIMNMRLFALLDLEKWV